MRWTGDHAMTSTTTKSATELPDAETSVYLFDDWFDPIEAGLRERVRGFLETMFRTELDAVLARPRYARQPLANHGSKRIDEIWPAFQRRPAAVGWKRPR